MSSLLQFGGQISRKGVHLQFIHEAEITWPHVGISGPHQYLSKESKDGIYLPGGKYLQRIWTAPRKPCGMFGCWVVFRYNGEEHVPDLSVPISVDKLPRDAQPLPIDETIKIWTS